MISSLLIVCIWNVDGAKRTLQSSFNDALTHDFILLREEFVTKTLNLLNSACFNKSPKHSVLGGSQNGISISITKHLKMVRKAFFQNENYRTVALEELNLIVTAAFFALTMDLDIIYH